MPDSTTDTAEDHIDEFSLGMDPFREARDKGPGPWITAHLFSGTNKHLFIFTIFSTIFSSVLSSGIIVVVGLAITDFIGGSTETLIFYVWVIFCLGIGVPILTLTGSLIREILAQRVERDARKEFYTSLLQKSQSFHDLQRIGDLMARATNDVRFLNFLVNPALSLIINA
ncbi:MAG: hypothetical protein HWN66_04400, partial [Candidatus Helarchaeota archaeon]|nr:hypothetical protein [Candidatus Helarchaeota archaeon]